MKSKIVLLFFLLGVAFSLYGRSLHYGFVYDDVFRVKNNAAIRTLERPQRFFLDPTTQSNHTVLNEHAYRPLVPLHFAVDYALWKDNPAGYRFENILAHGLNGFLVALLAMALFDLSLFGALAAGLIFIVHPIQVEAVVWIVERSNVMSTMLLLIAILCWTEFRRNENNKYLIFSISAFIGSLLYREIAFCFPILLLLTEWGFPMARSHRRWKWIFLMIVLDLVYFVLRWKLIGQVKIDEYWGGTWATNISTVFMIWPNYIRSALLPLNQNVHPFQQYTVEVFGRMTWPGLFSFLCMLVLTILAWKKSQRVAFCLSACLLLWIPGSGIIPHSAFFAERLMYPIMIFVACLWGLVFDRPILFKSFMLAGLALFYSVRTAQYLPVWENNLTLWEHSVALNPRGWMGWAGLGDGQTEKANQYSPIDQPAERQYWFGLAESSYIRALKEQVPTVSAADIFYSLSIVNLKQGKIPLADEHARRAIALNPALEPRWKNVRYPKEVPVQ